MSGQAKKKKNICVRVFETGALSFCKAAPRAGAGPLRSLRGAKGSGPPGLRGGATPPGTKRGGTPLFWAGEVGDASGQCDKKKTRFALN